MLLVRLGYHDAHEREEEMTAQLPAATLRPRVGLLACTFALAGSCAGERDLPSPVQGGNSFYMSNVVEEFIKKGQQ
jgi:hypothetical protein